MTRHDSSMKKCWERCEAFNDSHPVGTKVRYRPVAGTDEGIIESKTRSVAWAIPCAEAVVCIEGKSGGVSLDHIEVST